MLVGVERTVAALLTALRITALVTADLRTAERTAFTALTLPIETAWRTAHL